jgi:hypothetical protein
MRHRLIVKTNNAPLLLYDINNWSLTVFHGILHKRVRTLLLGVLIKHLN